MTAIFLPSVEIAGKPAPSKEGHHPDWAGSSLSSLGWVTTAFTFTFGFTGRPALDALGGAPASAAPDEGHWPPGDTGVAPGGLNPSNMVAYDGEIYFNGYDTNGDQGLWETNGTASGTIEIFAVATSTPAGSAAAEIVNIVSEKSYS